MIESEIEIKFKEILTASDWKQRQNMHQNHVDDFVGEYLVNRSKHIEHPVFDFLFEYYHFRASALRTWSPGLEIALEFNNQDELPELKDISVQNNLAYIDPFKFPENRRKPLLWMLSLLENSASKRPSFGCFGMHEWAMVYRKEEVRHNQLPLRMSDDDLAEFVESRPLLCTHFDAFRFFSDSAKPMNRQILSREEMADNEQPGCIHTNMDLYKWAFKLFPWVSSNTVLDAFNLAFRARTVDMQASPYDLEAFGFEPIKIETEEGRIKYKKLQESIFEGSIPIRNQLVKEYKNLVSLLDL